MGTNIFNIGQSALNAAQVGISTAGHNIANASTAGYSRQVVVQTTAGAQNYGYGYVGQGTEVSTIKRIYNELLAKQVTNTQSNSSRINTYNAEMSKIDNMLADSSAGLSPVLQDFFSSIHDLTANPSDASTRQAMLSTAQSLANRFHSMGERLGEIRDSVNSQLTSSVNLVNSYASQIAELNDIIEKSVNGSGNPPNDLMDQRDQLIAELSKETKTTVVPQSGGSYNVLIGNGLPLVIGINTLSLTTVKSPTDANRLEVAYKSQTNSTILNGDSLAGGTISGLLQFRANSLDGIQNQLGQIAVALTGTFNTQHAQGLDSNGNPGGAFFTMPVPTVAASTANTGTATLSGTITDATAITSSNYRLQYDGTNYKITRLSDKSVQSFTSLPQTLDGVTLSATAGMAAGDDFLIKPTANAATTFNLAISDINKIAIGGYTLSAAANSGNTGSATISTPVTSSTYAASPLSAPFSLTYASGTNQLTGFPATEAVTVTSGGTTTTYAAGSPVTYTSGATISVAGLSFVMNGAPSNTDQFTITPNTTIAPGNNQNGLLLAGLQNLGTVNNSSTSYASAFGQIVSSVGNKTRELQVTGAAEEHALSIVTAAQQSESGVNLDEEATNLLRYQQAYQAAGKMMQIASQLFDVLLSIKQ
ncbi:MAG: flagellar hook-associated protein FlgK [Methylotenera sp.]